MGGSILQFIFSPKTEFKSVMHLFYDIVFKNQQVYNRRLMTSLKSSSTQVANGELGQEFATQKRDAACDLLVRLLPFSWYGVGGDDPIQHYCPPGCCRSREEAVANISLCLENVMFSLLPMVPALNKWNKMWQPTAWWQVASRVAGGIVVTAFANLSGELGNWADRPLLREDHIVGLNDQECYRVKQGVRFRKAARFLSDPLSGKRLSIAVISMTECLEELATFFRGSKLAAPANVIKWTDPSTSPGVRACEKFAVLLLDQDSPTWLLVHGGHAWDHESLHMSASILLSLLGDTFLRCVLPFNRYPWRICRLIHTATSREMQGELGTEVMRLEPCCCDPGFTSKLVRLCGTQQALLSRHWLDFLHDYFRMCPDNNIQVVL